MRSVTWLLVAYAIVDMSIHRSIYLQLTRAPPSVGVANFSRDYAPGTPINSLTARFTGLLTSIGSTITPLAIDAVEAAQTLEMDGLVGDEKRFADYIEFTLKKLEGTGNTQSDRNAFALIGRARLKLRPRCTSSAPSPR